MRASQIIWHFGCCKILFADYNFLKIKINYNFEIQFILKLYLPLTWRYELHQVYEMLSEEPKSENIILKPKTNKKNFNDKIKYIIVYYVLLFYH